jgi:hypothetical protein
MNDRGQDSLDEPLDGTVAEMRRGRRARARKSATVGLEPADEARVIALMAVRDAYDAGNWSAVGHAARVVIEAYEQDPQVVVERLLGSPEAFLAWIERVRPALERRVAKTRLTTGSSVAQTATAERSTQEAPDGSQESGGEDGRRT